MEPLLTRVYMQNLITAGEKVLATLRLELVRTLLMQKVKREGGMRREEPERSLLS
jgi:hypothetical protein